VEGVVVERCETVYGMRDELCCAEAYGLVLCGDEAEGCGEDVGRQTAAGRLDEGRRLFLRVCSKDGLICLVSIPGEQG
jgi:hypothetical protein